MTVMRTKKWDIPPTAFRDVLRALAFRYHKWDLTVNERYRVLPESIVLSRPAHEQIVKATEAFAAAIRRFEARERRHPAVAAALGIDNRLFELINAASPRESAFCRADFFLTPEGRWVISEFNEDVPGGFNETVGIHELVDAATLGGKTEGDLKKRMVEAFEDCENIGMIFATGFSEDLQHSVLFAQWLEEAGHSTVLASPGQLEWRRGPCLAKLPIHGAFRFFPGEWLALLPNVKTWIQALPLLRMMNPPVRLLAQSKRSFGLWQNSHPLAPEDSWLCREYLPQTEFYSAAKEEYYRAEREHLVLKRAFGRMGDAVMIGALVQPQEWNTALATAGRNPDEYAVQARFQVEPLLFETGRMYPTIGAYAVDGRFAGYYSRVAPQPFITSEAYYVATVVEAA